MQVSAQVRGREMDYIQLHKYAYKVIFVLLSFYEFKSDISKMVRFPADA